MGLNLPTLALAKKYTDLKTSVTDKQINAAVNQYLENNPVSPGASPEESAQIGANKQNITNLQNEIVMRSPAIITEAIGTGKVRMDDSSSNPFIGMGIKGRSGQVVTTGAQLLDLSAINKSVAGAVVNYADGGYSISGTGALTASFTASQILDIKNALKPGNLILKSELTIPKLYIRIWDGNTVLAEMQRNSTKQVTQEMIDNENVRVECFLCATAGNTITPGTYHPMLYQSGDGTWEPYTGGQPSPSPDYPQEIVGTDVTAVTVTGANNQSKTASITLTEPLRGIDDHNDMITMTKRIDRCVEMTFDGRENWAAISTYEGFYYAGILPFSAMRRAGLCNQFPVDTKGDAIESVRIGNGNSVLFCVHSRFYDDAASDKGLSAWKAHLASHPLKVVTYLDTPVETDLDADTIAALAELTTYKGHTTVSVAAGGPEPDITMEYIADTKTYIANEHAKMQAEFDKQIAAILALLPAETQAAMINNETSALLAESEV